MKKYTLFQKSILNELDEFDEFDIILSIPWYKEVILKEDILNPIWDYKENFEISDNDFDKMRNEVLDLMEKEDLGLYIDIYTGGKTWEESYKKLSNEDTSNFFSNKENWIWKEGGEVYYLIRNSDIP